MHQPIIEVKGQIRPPKGGICAHDFFNETYFFTGERQSNPSKLEQ